MMLSRFSGSSPLDTWEWVVGQPNLPLRCCTGSPDIESAMKALEVGDKAVIDPITLYGVVRLGLAQKVRVAIANLGVVQTTLDLLRREVHERRENIERRQGSFGWDGQRYYMAEADRDIANRRVAVAEEALAFAESLALMPSEPDSGIKQEATPLFEDCDPAFLDTIYAAQGGKCLLYCDDMLFRQVAEEIAGVKGVWTQAVVLAGGRGGKVTLEDYEEVTRALAGSDYRFTTVGYGILQKQLISDEWRVSAAFRNMADQIAQPANDATSVTRMLADLMKHSWRAAPDKRVLVSVWTAIFAAFRRAQPDRDLIQLANEVIAALAPQFQCNVHRAMFRRRLMESTVHTPVDAIIGEVNKVVERLLERMAKVFEQAIAKSEA